MAGSSDVGPLWWKNFIALIGRSITGLRRRLSARRKFEARRRQMGGTQTFVGHYNVVDSVRCLQRIEKLG